MMAMVLAPRFYRADVCDAADAPAQTAHACYKLSATFGLLVRRTRSASVRAADMPRETLARGYLCIPATLLHVAPGVPALATPASRRSFVFAHTRYTPNIPATTQHLVRVLAERLAAGSRADANTAQIIAHAYVSCQPFDILLTL
jgi:hypothetical protein